MNKTKEKTLGECCPIFHPEKWNDKVYEKVTGEYTQSAAVSDLIYTDLKNEFGAETFKGFGIYYDNPKKVAKKDLYSEVGCILEPGDYNKMDTLKTKFEVKEFPSGEYLVVEFPFKGKLSVLVGVMRVYPDLAAFARGQGYNVDSPVMEIWDVKNGVITYRKQLIKNGISKN